MTRTGNRLTTADVTEWDGDDEMEYSIYNYNHNANGAMTFDSMSGISGTVFSWNAAGLLHAFVDDDSSERVEIIWLSDGTKVKMDGDVDSPRYYRGSFVYKDVSISVPTGYDEGDYDTYDFEGLESIAHSEGRFVATDWTTTGVPTLSDRHFVRDLVGSTVTVIDVARAAVASNLPTLNAALVEQDAYLAYGDRLSASAMTLKTDTDNRYRFNGKERHDWAGYAYIDYGARMYNPVTGSWLSPDPLADKYTSFSPYVFCAGDPVNYVDKKGEFPLAANIAGAVVAMATDYVSQAVANVIVNGFSIDAFTRDIDLIDIGVAGVEGFLTMGSSAIKNATVKTATRAAVSATSAAISNTINYKVSEQEITYNPVEQVVTGTMVGAVVGAIPGSDKTMEVMKPRTNSKAVETARVTAHAEGKKFSAESAKTVAKENTARNVTVKKVNETVTDLVDSNIVSTFTDTGQNTFWNYLKEK